MAHTQLNKPTIINIMLSSLDGKIAFHDKESSSERSQNQFSSQEDFKRMRTLVSQCDAVFLGLKSIECEKGAFRVADLRPSNTEPEWIIFTQKPEVPAALEDMNLKSPFWKQENIFKSLFFVSSFDINEAPFLKSEIKVLHSHKINCLFGNIGGLFQYLINKSCKKAALLGGGKLNSVFWAHNLVEELYLTLTPFIIGRNETPKLIDTHSFIQQKLVLKNFSCQNNFVFLDYETEKK